MIVASELATNAILHARTDFRVSVTVDSDSVRVEVEDGGAAMNVATEMARGRGGYGLQVVEQLAIEWGVENRGRTKAVWVKLPRVGEADTRPSP